MDFPGNHPNPSDATGLKYRHQPFRQVITYINIDSYINNRIASNSVISMTGNNPSSVKQPTDTPTLSKSKGRKGTDRQPPCKCPMQPDMTPGQATSHHAMCWFWHRGYARSRAYVLRMVGTSWGEGRGNTLIPPTAHPKMRPRREISSQRKESHQSHWTAVLFAHSRWRDFLSLCLYYAVVCGFIMD